MQPDQIRIHPELSDKKTNKKSRKSSGASGKSSCESGLSEPLQTYDWMKLRRVGANGVAGGKTSNTGELSL